MRLHRGPIGIGRPSHAIPHALKGKQNEPQVLYILQKLLRHRRNL